jgi:hypothetical protein
VPELACVYIIIDTSLGIEVLGADIDGYVGIFGEFFDKPPMLRFGPGIFLAVGVNREDSKTLMRLNARAKITQCKYQQAQNMRYIHMAEAMVSKFPCILTSPRAPIVSLLILRC